MPNVYDHGVLCSIIGGTIASTGDTNVDDCMHA